MTGIRVFRNILIALLAFPLAACPAVDLKRLDDEWSRAYVQSVNPDFLVSEREALKLTFAEIAKRAEQSGDKVKDEDPKTAISYFMLASISGWKSGQATPVELEELTRKGNVTCGKVAEKEPAGQPRDCEVFKFVPLFAGADAEGRNVRALLARVQDADLTKLPDTDIGILETAKKNLNANFTATRREVLAAKSGGSLYPENLTSGFVNENWQRINCHAVRVEGLLLAIAIAKKQPDSVGDADKAAAAARKNALIAEKLNPRC